MSQSHYVREHPARGHHGSFQYRLTDEQVVEIRIKWNSTRDLKQGDPEKVTYAQLMRDYNVGRNTVYKVIKNISYPWVRVKWERGEWVWMK